MNKNDMNKKWHKQCINKKKADEIQKQFKLKLNETTTGNPKHKSKDQLNTMKNHRNLYNSREKVNQSIQWLC